MKAFWCCCRSFHWTFFICATGSAVLYASSLSAQRDIPYDTKQVATGDRQSTESDRIAAALKRPVTVSLERASLKAALRAIADDAKIRVQYRNSTIDSISAPITLHARQLPLSDALSQVLQGTRLHAIPLREDLISIVPTSEKPGVSQTQDSVEHATVLGALTDSASGGILAGVTVSVRGTKITALTDAKGAFTLRQVPFGDQVLEFKLLGYTSVTRSVNVTNKRPVFVRVALKVSAAMLSGVVTTATGEQRKLEVGNSITTLNVDSIMQTAPITSVTDLLEARVPGLTVQRTSGSPGDPARIRLRGAASIYQNNDPIIVVDGIRVYSQQSDSRNLNAGGREVVDNLGNTNTLSSYATPSPLDQIDPHTIETIEVLKGPSASALYGSDAANGVIVITTKRGRSGPARWNVAANQSISNMPGRWPTGNWVWGTASGGGQPITCLGLCRQAGTVDSMKSFQALNDPRYTPLGTGHDAGLSGTVSGGNPSIQYSFTASGGKTVGILKLPIAQEEQYLKSFGQHAPGWMRRPDGMQQWSTSGRVSVRINEQANIDVTTMLSKQAQKRTSMSNSTETAIAELQGKYVDESLLAREPLLGNPYERVTSDLTTLTNAAQLRYQPTPWLPITATLGISTQSRDDQNLLGRGLIKVASDNRNGDSTGFLRAGHGAATNYSAAIFSNTQLRKQLSLASGLNYSRSNTNDWRGGFTDIPAGVTDPSAGANTTTTTFTRITSGQQTFGWFLEPKLNLNSRFFAVPGFRLDNNGLSGQNAKLLGLPKLNFSWIASDEPHFPFKDAIPLLRIRTAFGVAGVQPSPQDGLRLYSRQTVGTGSAAALEAYGQIMPMQSLGNTRLRPERGHEIEGGFDTELWNGRLSMDVTHYRKTRLDAIIGNPVANSVGGGSIKTNLGDILNTGTEISVNAQLLEQRNIGWHVNAALSRNTSKILRLGREYRILLEQMFGQNSISTYYVEGYPMNGLWEKPIYGFVDLDGNGSITTDEILIGTDTIAYMGTSDPNYQLNLRSGLTLFRGRLGIHAGFSYVSGLTQRDLASSFCLTSCSGARANWVTSPFALAINDPNSSAAQQAAVWASQNRQTAYGLVRTTSTLRFQSLSVNVNLGTGIARWVRAGNASIAIQGNNLGLWSNYYGKDPNVNAFSTGQMIGDLGQLPQPRTWTLRMTVGR